MDLSRLPNILALALLILTYQPLVRRSGAHVRWWFVGWTAILLNCLNQLLAGPDGTGAGGALTGVSHLVSTLTLEGGGLAFLMGVANNRERLITRTFLAALAAAPVVQALLFCVHTTVAGYLMPAANALFLLPAACVAMQRRSWPRSLMIVAAAFAVFGLSTLELARQPGDMRAGSLLLIFVSAAYLLFRTARRYSRGVVVTGIGLAFWGVKYSLLAILTHWYPDVTINVAILELPEYLVVAGSVLSMIEERLEAAERLATHDPLTNLPNRRRFEERFAEALKEARARRMTVACLVIDVDNFKRINDTMGHSAGDALLRALAVRLAWHMSPRDLLARTGGDEFTAMLAGVKNDHYLRFVAGAMMSAVSVPVQVEGQPVDVRISMGIALSPDDADEIDDLVRLADQAMYRAKRRGGNVLEFAGEAAADPAEGDATVARQEISGLRQASAQILQMVSPVRTRMENRG